MLVNWIPFSKGTESGMPLPGRAGVTFSSLSVLSASNVTHFRVN